VHLRPNTDVDLEALDGFVVTGGLDVHPTLYEALVTPARRYDFERDRFELRVLAHALDRGLPVLAICRGAQLLNVQLGGTLHQDIRPERRHRPRGTTPFPLRDVRVSANTSLRRILGRDSLRVNSLHRQSVNRLGRGLQVSAIDLDGIVQCVEHTTRDFVIGVQWHPELLLYRSGQRRLFESVVRVAATRMCGRVSPDIVREPLLTHEGPLGGLHP